MEYFQNGIQLILKGGGIQISIIGMLVVFLGLTLIFFAISLLPSMIALGERLLPAEAHPHPGLETEKLKSTLPLEVEEMELMTVIAAVIELEKARLADENQKITFKRGEGRGPSLWASAGKMRPLPGGKR